MAAVVVSLTCAFCCHGGTGRVWQVYPPLVDRTLVRAVIMATARGMLANKEVFSIFIIFQKGLCKNDFICIICTKKLIKI